jgi:hypothetical protein
MAEIGQIQMINFRHYKKVKKKGETLLQNDFSLRPYNQSAVAVLVQTEPLRSGPVHG